MDRHYESICESCTFFVTTIQFRPTLQAQRDDAQLGRQRAFDGLSSASTRQALRWRSPDEYEAASWTQLAAQPASSTIQFDSMGAR
jgi:hypothetical protein